MPTAQNIESNLNDINRKSVAIALKTFDKTEELAKHPLASLTLIEQCRSTYGYQASSTGIGLAVKQLLLDAVESLKPAEQAANPHMKTWRPYLIAVERYVNGHTPSYVSDFLAIARTTYNHEQTRMLDMLAATLKEWEHDSVQQKTKASKLGTSSRTHREDWGEARDISGFCGRKTELQQLRHWVVQERCHLIGIVGIGGVGKTALLEKVAKEIAEEFDFVIWRSLVNAPEPTELFSDLIRFLVGEEPIEMPVSIDKRLALLLDCLRHSRCLLILDNVESILQAEEHAGQYRVGYQAYGQLIRNIGEQEHQSCLCLTTRERTRELDFMASAFAHVHILEAQGLDSSTAKAMMLDQALQGSPAEWNELIDLYSGNPLALQLVTAKIQKLFDSNIAAFLQEGTPILSEIRELLSQQCERMSPLESTLLYWLMIEREPVSLIHLRQNFIHAPRNIDLFDALDSLVDRCLVERVDQKFALQTVVLEYLTEKFIAQIAQELCANQFTLFANHALMLAQAKEYIRQSQLRTILRPMAEELCRQWGSAEAAGEHLLAVLSEMRVRSPFDQGYAVGNTLNLLVHLHVDLRHCDLSRLIVRQAHLQDVSLYNVNFAHTQLRDTVFSESFDIISAMAFDQTGDILIAGTAVGSILLWQSANGIPLSNWKAHDYWVLSLAVSPDGQVLATGGEDQIVKLWELHSGRCIRTLHGHTARVRSVAFHPAGTMLVSGSDDGTIQLWNLQTGRSLQTLRGHVGRIRSVAINNNGQLLASGSEDATVKLWDLDSGEILETLDGHSDHVMTVAFDHNGHILASGSRDGTIRLWNAHNHSDTIQKSRILRGHAKPINGLAFSPDGRLIMSGSSDETVRVWDLQSSQCIKIMHEHTSRIRSVAVHPNGSILASGSEDQTVKLWDIEACGTQRAGFGRCIKTLRGHSDWLRKIAISPNGQLLAVCGFDTAIKVWDIDTEQIIGTLRGHTKFIESLAFSADGTTIVSGSEDHVVKLWDIRTYQCIKTYDGHTSRVRTVAFSPNGRFVASGSADRTVKVWDRSNFERYTLSNHDCLHTFQGHSHHILTVAFHPDSQIMASGSYDGTVILWDINSGQRLYTLHGHTDWVRSIAFSPDGTMLASGSDDKTVKIWQVNSGTCLETLQGHTDRVRSVAIHASDCILATGSEDSTVKLWDMRNWQCIRTLQGHTSRVVSISFRVASREVASGSEDNSIRFWSTDTGECLKIIRPHKLYEGMNITGVTGLTESQRLSLKHLGAVENI